MSMVSIIVPCYNEAAAFPIFYAEATKVLASMDADYEFTQLSHAKFPSNPCTYLL